MLGYNDCDVSELNRQQFNTWQNVFDPSQDAHGCVSMNRCPSRRSSARAFTVFVNQRLTKPI